MPRGKNVKRAKSYNSIRKIEEAGSGAMALFDAVIRRASMDHVSAVTGPDSDDAKTVQDYADSFFDSDIFELYSLGMDGEEYLKGLDWQIEHGFDFAGDNESVKSIAKQIREINTGRRHYGLELERKECEIREMAERNETLDEISKKTGCSKRAVSLFAKGHGIRIKGMWNPDEAKRRRNRPPKRDGQDK